MDHRGVPAGGQRASQPLGQGLEAGDPPAPARLIQRAEAAQLALEVAARAPEAAQRLGLPVDGVELGEGVDHGQAERPAVGAGRDRVGDHGAVERLHHVERRADQLRVLADGEDARDADALLGERELQPRLAHDIVRGRRQWRRRRASQHDARPTPLDQVGQVEDPSPIRVRRAGSPSGTSPSR